MKILRKFRTDVEKFLSKSGENLVKNIEQNLNKICENLSINIGKIKKKISNYENILSKMLKIFRQQLRIF